MKCQNCGERDANVRYYQNINGRKQEVFLCSECADELNIMDGFSNFDMFSDFLGDFGGLRLLEMPRLLRIKTPRILEDQNYYDRTNPELEEALKDITSRNKGLSKKAKLEKELQDCIKEEKYERAAEIRDELKKMNEN